MHAYKQHKDQQILNLIRSETSTELTPDNNTHITQEPVRGGESQPNSDLLNEYLQPNRESSHKDSVPKTLKEQGQDRN